VKELATIQAGDGDAFMWSRFIFGPFNGANLIDQRNKVIRTVQFRFKGSTGPFNDKLSHIISGHTIMRAPFTLFGQTNIDTCAYATGDKEPPKYAALTCVELGSWSFYQATPTTFRTVEPFVVNTDVINSLKEPNEAPL
jgi:hypothetical protein